MAGGCSLSWQLAQGLAVWLWSNAAGAQAFVVWQELQALEVFGEWNDSIGAVAGALVALPL